MPWRPARLVLCLGLGLLCGCGRNTPLGELFTESRTPHEEYADALRRAGLDSTALGRDWLVAADSALEQPLTASLPMEEVGVYQRHKVHAVTHRVSLRHGQRLQVTLRAEGIPARIFLDLFEIRDDPEERFPHLKHAQLDSMAGARVIRHEARRTGDVIVRIQPELLRDGRYTLTMALEPVLAFPVAGHGNRAIRSRFGVDRDGGARRHEGIDIFAPRGTAVLAAAPGVVRSTRPNDLGGNVVWLRDELRGQLLYYAHLDREVVTEGQELQVGDTIGYVGNTGNARTTPPHLHFGIYRRPGGAIDPFDWVALTDTAAPRIEADLSRLGARVVVRAARLLLHAGPTPQSDSVRSVTRIDSLQVLGANASWYRVQRLDGSSGYVRARSVVAAER